MFLLQIFNLHAKGQSAGTPDFKTVIVDCQAHCSTCLSVVPMTECIDQCFPQCNRRKERLIDTFKQPGLNTARYGQMSGEKLHRFG